MGNWLFWAVLGAPLTGAAGVWAISLYGRAIPGNGWRNGRDGILWGTQGLALLACLVLAVWPDAALSVPGVGVRGLYFTAGGVRGLLALLTAAFWLLAGLYNRGYLAHMGHKMRYYWFWMIAECAALGACYAADLFTAVFFLPPLVMCMAVLTAHTETAAARRAASRLLTINVAGGIAAIAGVVWLARLLGGLRYTELTSRAALCGDPPALYLASGLTLLGLGAVCGLWPLNGWLCRASAQAPAPAAVLLCGVLPRAALPALLALEAASLRRMPWNVWALLACGLVTMLWEALRALWENDLRRLAGRLAGSGSGAAVMAASFALLAGQPAGGGAVTAVLLWGLAPAVLVLCAGSAETLLHSQELPVLQGCGRARPLYRAAFVPAMLCLAGVPLLAGYAAAAFIGGSAVRALGDTAVPLALPAICLAALFCWNALLAAQAVRLWVRLFRAPNTDPVLQEKYDGPQGASVPKLSTAAVLCTAALTVFAGLWLNLVPGAAVSAAAGLLGQAAPEAVSLWDLRVLGGAALAVLGGAGGYLALLPRRARAAQPPLPKEDGR